VARQSPLWCRRLEGAFYRRCNGSLVARLGETGGLRYTVAHKPGLVDLALRCGGQVVRHQNGAPIPD
jgi:hypothetical protein